MEISSRNFDEYFKNKGGFKKISTFCCVFILGCGLINTSFEEIFKNNNNVTYKTNNFLNEEVSLHSDNYRIKANSVNNLDRIKILNKNKEQEELEGYFISVNLTIKKDENSKLKAHKIDKNDFKLKDHTGTYLRLNDFASLIGLDAIDLHYDTHNGNHVVSSADFYTVNAINDYNYIDYLIESGKENNFNLYFKMFDYFDVTKEIIVLEVDFYVGASGYRIGEDIILLERKEQN